MKYRIQNPADKHRIIQRIDQINYADGWQVEFTKYRESKTLPQLKTIHLWIREIQEFFAEGHGKYYTDEDIKTWLKGLFGVKEIFETPSGKRQRYKSFADYKIDEMAKLMEDVQNYAVSELGCFLTLPGYED